MLEASWKGLQLYFLNIFNIGVQVYPTNPCKILFVLLQSQLEIRETHCGAGSEMDHIADDYKVHERQIINHVRN